VTTLSPSTRTLPAAELGPESRLPRFKLQLGAAPNPVAVELSPEERAGLLGDLATPVLPYGVQDRYGRARRPCARQVLVLENERLRATVDPALGGRLVSLRDLDDGRELLFANPVLQPANLAVCDAWVAGGVEWNGLSYGHGPTTCRPVFAARGRAPDGGPLCRLYAFDRQVECVLRVELWLPAGERLLVVGVRLENPNPEPRELFWWTNLALPMGDATRVLSPTGPVLRHAYDGALVRAPFPELEPGLDGSYPVRHRSAADVYFRPPASARPFIAAVEADGRGLVEASTPALGGRKLFTWGSSPGGRRWRAHLGGDYLELQAGLTPTQVQTFRLGAGGAIAFCEGLAPLALAPAAAHARDYRRACEAARAALEGILPASELATRARALASLAGEPAEEVLFRGEAWAMLEERRRGRALSPGLAFEAPLGEAEAPWAELLSPGGFSAASLAREPTSWNVSAGWRARLAAAPASWLSELQLGLAALEAGELEAARSHLEASRSLRPSSAAERALAILALAQGHEDAGLAGYLRAFALAPGPELAEELAGLLAARRRFDELERFASALPGELAGLERVRIARAELCAERGELAAGLDLLEGDFATIREGEVVLHRVWLALHARPEERRLGRPLTREEQRALFARHPLPARLDFGVQPAEVVLGLSSSQRP
jgi:hypothetical protein